MLWFTIIKSPIWFLLIFSTPSKSNMWYQSNKRQRRGNSFPTIQIIYLVNKTNKQIIQLKIKFVYTIQRKKKYKSLVLLYEVLAFVFWRHRLVFSSTITTNTRLMNSEPWFSKISRSLQINAEMITSPILSTYCNINSTRCILLQ